MKKLYVGQEASLSKAFTAKDVELFSELIWILTRYTLMKNM